MLHFWIESQNAGTASQNYGTEKGTHIWEFFWKFLSCTSGCQFLVHFWTKLIRKLHNKQLGQNDEFWFLNKMAILQILPFSKIGRISLLTSIGKVGRCYIQMFRWRTLFLVTGTTEIFSWAIGNTVFSWKLFFSDQVITHCKIDAYLEEDERLRDPHKRPDCATGSSQPAGIDVGGPRTDSWGYHSRNRRRRGWNMNSGNWQIRPRRRSWPFLTETNEEKL